MREIKTYNHTEGLYLNVYHTPIDKLKETIREWKTQVKPDCIEHNADHYIFQTTTYDSDNNIIELNLYAVPLDDEEFHKRINALVMIENNKGNSVYIGAWHKGTSY